MIWIIEKIAAILLKKFVESGKPGDIAKFISETLRNDEEVKNAIRESEKDFRDFLLLYEGAFIQLPATIQYIRTLVRPVTTISFLLTTLFLVIFGREVPAKLWALDFIMVSFWYGERAFIRLKKTWL